MNYSLHSLWNSHFVGAYLLWRLVKGYSGIAGHGLDLLLVFPLLQLIATPALTKHIPSGRSKTQSLEEYIVNIIRSKEQYLILDLAQETMNHREWISQSITIGVVTRLMTIDYENARLELGIKVNENEKMKTLMPELRKETGAKAEKLGRWIGALTAAEVMGYLGVSVT